LIFEAAAPKLHHHTSKGRVDGSGDLYSLNKSRSRKGNCWDNAVAESFFKTLKTEATDEVNFKTFAEAKYMVFEYIEVYYNRQRMHSSIQYQIPAEYEAQRA
jgi:transposase InsO family protein